MSVIELAKSLIPSKLHMPLKQVYVRVPLKIRMGKKYWELRTFLHEAQWWEHERIAIWQFEKLKEILQFSYKNVPGYNALYREAGVKPEDIASLADVRFLPFTTKELIRDNVKDFTARNISSWERRYVTTGGSTGIPLGFYHTDINVWMENAFMHSGWERVGWQLGDLSAVLRGGFVGSEKCLWEYDPGSRELRLSSYYLTEHTYSEYVKAIEKFRPKHLQAYPSCATKLADLILDNGEVGRIEFDIILLGSENVYQWQQNKLKEAFPHSRLFAWYGHSEQTVLAPWCEGSNDYHVWPFYGLTEIVGEDNEPIKKGATGELIGTSFFSRATPFIRYRTGDIVQYKDTYCPFCNRSFLILGDIVGRQQNYLVTQRGRTVPVPTTSMHDDTLDNVAQFQFYQDTPGKVIFRIVPKKSYTPRDTDRIQRELIRKLGDDMRLEIEFVAEIPRTQRGKYRFLEQKLDVMGNA